MDFLGTLDLDNGITREDLKQAKMTDPPTCFICTWVEIDLKDFIRVWINLIKMTYIE